ncbi:hypothetical protein N0V90_005972 [Kalmusia sp. IMI 367209]|nr:hypothetical protein N0V90_005972 [Kalmusia sp. IMI 367209]
MCKVQFLLYACGHSRYVLIGDPCPETGMKDEEGIPINCRADLKVEHINVPGDCEVRSLLLGCKDSTRIDHSQNMVLYYSEELAINVKIQSLKLARRISTAIVHLTGGMFQVRPYAYGEQPHWKGASTANYPDLETMLNAAWFSNTQSRYFLAHAFTLCAIQIMSGFYHYKERNDIFVHQKIAERFTLPIDSWIKEMTPLLEDVAQAMEKLAATGDGAVPAFKARSARFIGQTAGDPLNVEQVTQAAVDQIDETIAHLEEFSRRRADWFR